MILERAFEVFQEVNQSIKKLEDRHGKLPDEFEFNYNDPEERSKNYIAMDIMYKLESVKDLLDWIEKPVHTTGSLVKNANGRYSVGSHELSSGYHLEYFGFDNTWERSRIEHSGQDYYIVGLGKGQSIEGVLVRLR